MVKTCPVCKKKLAGKSALKQHMDAQHKALVRATPRPNPAQFPAAQGRSRGGNRSGTSYNNDGEGKLSLVRSELVRSVEVKAQQVEISDYLEFLPSDSTMVWLNNLARNFDQIVWLNVRIEFKPAVGTNVSGSLVLGIDWDPASGALNRQQVQACSPASEAPVWQQQELVVPTSRLQSRRFYLLKSKTADDRSPFSLKWNLKTNADKNMFYGDIWVHYKVVLMGPSA
nr:VP3 [Ulaatai Melophagus solemo-like virus]